MPQPLILHTLNKRDLLATAGRSHTDLVGEEALVESQVGGRSGRTLVGERAHHNLLQEEGARLRAVQRLERSQQPHALGAGRLRPVPRGFVARVEQRARRRQRRLEASRVNTSTVQ